MPVSLAIAKPHRREFFFRDILAPSSPAFLFGQSSFRTVQERGGGSSVGRGGGGGGARGGVMDAEAAPKPRNANETQHDPRYATNRRKISCTRPFCSRAFEPTSGWRPTPSPSRKDGPWYTQYIGGRPPVPSTTTCASVLQYSTRT